MQLLRVALMVRFATLPVDLQVIEVLQSTISMLSMHAVTDC